MARIERERMLKAQQRIVRTFEVEQHIAEVAPQFGIVRLELYRLVERLERVLEPPLMLQRAAEARQIFRLRVLPDRARQPLQAWSYCPASSDNSPIRCSVSA